MSKRSIKLAKKSLKRNAKFQEKILSVKDGECIKMNFKVRTLILKGLRHDNYIMSKFLYDQGLVEV